jgi:hypothetical protein
MYLHEVSCSQASPLRASLGRDQLVSQSIRQSKQCCSRLLNSATRYLINALRSAVQVPEFDGWKKLSVEIIIRDRESNALLPARYALVFLWASGCPASRCSAFRDGGQGVDTPDGVAVPEGGNIGPSVVIEYTMILARETGTER